ncbi:GAP1-N1 domain-containing protein [Variovorax paradoxus]|uniref:GAP1-N1 domain-containing protein n=1 Tax=Variovorax paradoxus TaxID=34073 RepID=UPI002784E78A|nr:hypothetical protein [Variovorax paradoxus]MDQ0589895.1 hypothetical protein [Variovorax paradoxus]
MGTTVHQALHGYSEGHRQFACSAKLAPNDARHVLVMSDSSGAGVTAEGISYLTGYPLQESGLYALARTWPAPEMPRPGCVWTHTLFIEFADLALLDSPSQLEQLFRVPSVETSRTYGVSVDLTAAAPATRALTPNEVSLFQRLATALYEHPREQVWARRAGDRFVDDMVLRLWDLQWPRLRRSFRFCTLTTRDRSQEGSLFDLQLCAESLPRLRFPEQADGIEANTISIEPWLVQLVEYADRPSATGFREALRLLGTDVLGGREAMRSICSLQAVLARREPAAVEEAIALVQSSAPLSSSKVAQVMVVSAVLSRSDELSPDALGYVVTNLDLVSDEELAQHASRLARSLWTSSPPRLVELLFDQRPTVQAAIREAAQDISVAELAQSLVPGTEWLWRLLQVRPDLTETPEFWRRTQPRASEIEDAGIKLQGGITLESAVLGLHDELAIESVARCFGALAVLETLQRLMTTLQELPQVLTWVKHACRDVGGAASFLAHVRTPSAQLVGAISNELAPDAIPNDYGIDPWFTALADLQSQGTLPLEIVAYGFRRGLGYRTRSAGPLLRLTFDAMHCSAIAGSFNDTKWQQFRDSLPWVKPADAWDVALRLRLAVGKRSVEAAVRAEDYVGITADDQVFLSLMTATWEHWGGQRYLKKIAEELQETSESQLIPRCTLLVSYIDRHSRWWK